MPKNVPSNVRIEPIAGKPVELPNGHFVANAEMTRIGTDLHLSSPDGHTIVVEGYFTQNPAPDLVTTDGARLSPQMVESFLPPEHIGQYASSGQITNDASSAGKITEVIGEAHIVRSDGTHILATVGTPVFQGDVIETSKTGAVNILFTDNTTFAVSESARLAVDQFVYNSAEQSGSSFFSMLQGMFVYTSGMIGKSDPGNVSIETPVGSIGIRGTVVAGEILPAGQESKITILDGAIALTNDSGTQELNTSFATVSLNSYQSEPVPIQMDAQTFSTTYSSLSSVAGDTLSHFDGTIAPATPAEPSADDTTTTDETPTEAAPTAETTEPDAPATDATVEPDATVESDATAEETAPVTPDATADTDTVIAPTVEIAPITDVVTDNTILSPPTPISDFNTTSVSSFDSTEPETISVSSTDETFVSSTTTTDTTTSTTTTSTTSSTLSPEQIEAAAAVDAASASSRNAQAAADAASTSYISAQNEANSAAMDAADAATAATEAHAMLEATTDAADIAAADAAAVAAATAATNTQNAATAALADATAAQTAATTAADALADAIAAETTLDLVAANAAVTEAAAAYTTAQASADAAAVDLAAAITAADDAMAYADIAATFRIGFIFSSEYTKDTEPTADDGSMEFAGIGTSLGAIAPINASGTLTYSVTINTPSVYHIVPDANSAAGTYDAGNTILTDANTIFSINSDGELIVNDPMAMTLFANPGGFDITITATDGLGNVDTATRQINIVDHPGTPYISSDASIIGTAGDEFLISASDVATSITGGGGADALIGYGTGDTTIQVSDASFKYIDGGEGNDTLLLGSNTDAMFNMDFSLDTAEVRSIENINLGISSTEVNVSSPDFLGNQISLSMKNVFDMTDPSDHTLYITADPNAVLSTVDVITGGTDGFTLGSYTGTWGSSTLTYTGYYNGSDINLVIDQGTIATNKGGIIVTDDNHAVPSIFDIDFTIAPEYSMNLAFGGEGLPEFDSNSIDLIIGDFTPFHNSGAVTYSVSVTNAVYTVDQNTTNSAGEYLTTLASTADNAIFSVNGSGELLVNDPMALSYDANPSGFDLVITATDSVGNTTAFDQHLDMRDYMPGIDPSVYFGTSPFVGTSGADFMIGGPDTEINGNGGADVLIGRNGDNNISVSDNAFIHVDGSGGNDTLTLGTVSSTNFTLDFTTFPEWKVKNIENIDLGMSDTMTAGFYVGNHIKLDIQDVFDMTDPITHTLHITSPVNSIDGLVEIIMSSASGDFTLGSGTVGIEGTGTTQLTYTGTHTNSGETVTLVIDQITVSGDASGDITVNQV